MIELILTEHQKQFTQNWAKNVNYIQESKKVQLQDVFSNLENTGDSFKAKMSKELGKYLLDVTPFAFMQRQLKKQII